MGNSSLCVLAATVVIGALSGCSVADTYRKCGLSGCPGDADITAKVRDQLARYPALQPPNLIRVQTYDRVVYLTGTVNTPLVRDFAGSVAAQVAGVRRVVDSVSLDYGGR
jgi:osmotically-inducible protein OsmY